MPEHLAVEVCYTDESHRAFAQATADGLKQLVAQVAPHIELDVHTVRAVWVTPSRYRINGQHFQVSPPSRDDHQSLLITNEPIGAQGMAEPGQGCLCKPLMEDKAARGGNPAEITIHEWLHTLYGKVINGRPVPNPDNAQLCGYHRSGVGRDGEDQWFEWYKFALGG